MPPALKSCGTYCPLGLKLKISGVLFTISYASSLSKSSAVNSAILLEYLEITSSGSFCAYLSIIVFFSASSAANLNSRNSLVSVSRALKLDCKLSISACKVSFSVVKVEIELVYSSIFSPNSAFCVEIISTCSSKLETFE